MGNNECYRNTNFTNLNIRDRVDDAGNMCNSGKSRF